jgi:hypothetical protein
LPTWPDLGSATGADPVELLSPDNTLIKTNRPTFIWFPDKPYDRFIVNLYNSKGFVWSSKVSESPMKYP